MKVYGTRYTKDCIVVTGLCHGIPIFGKIKRILVLEDTSVVFQYNTLEVLEFVEHLNAYRVKAQNETRCIKQDHLQDFYPLGFHTGFGCYQQQNFVVLKYRLDMLN